MVYSLWRKKPSKTTTGSPRVAAGQPSLLTTGRVALRKPPLRQNRLVCPSGTSQNEW